MPFTIAATAEMIVLAGCRLVFVDIEAGTCNIDASRIKAAITPRTRAIMPVSLYGQVADMDEVNAIAARHGLAVIEDAAQSFGTRYRDRNSCNLSTLGCTSNFQSKQLGCTATGALGISTAVHYPKPLARQPAYTQYASPGGSPNSAHAAEQVISLPKSADLAKPLQNLVVRALADALRRATARPDAKPVETR